MKKIPKVITITANKGGCGKTTTAAAVADILGKKRKVLVIDTDPQCNCAGKFGFKPGLDEDNLGQLLVNKAKPIEQQTDISLTDAIKTSTKFTNIGVLYGGKLLRGSYKVMFANNPGGALKAFKRLIEDISELGIYDYVVIDTPPSYGQEIYTILRATDIVLLPVISEKDSIEGVSSAIEFINEAREDNPGIKIGGIFINRYIDRDKSRNIIEPILRDAWKDYMLKTNIPDNRAASAMAINGGEPITRRCPRSKATKAFHSLVKEVFDV